MIRVPRRRAAAGAATLAALAATAVVAAPGSAISIKDRTLLISETPAGVAANGESSAPSLSGNARVLAFESTATDLRATGAAANGALRDVIVTDFNRNASEIVSVARDGGPADGASFDPVVSNDGRSVAFMSQATNLVPGDTNGVTDIFVRRPDGAIRRASVGAGGAQAAGRSSQPDVSADGRMVAFTSSAANLVEGDDNGRPDVFVHDLETAVTTMVSEDGRGTSSSPAISGDGRFVSFFSSSTNLVSDDVNRRADVFVHDLRNEETDLVSVSSDGEQQNRSILRPFTQVSDISHNGRYVAFDSDGTNLVGGDRNRDTDVFVRDRLRQTTSRVSVSSGREEGDNDSFNPTITPDGRFVAFQSFAESLVPVSGPREDVFLRDRRISATTVISVAAASTPRGTELVRQHLQRPVVSDHGQVAAFTSTAGNLVSGDGNRAEDVFLRIMAPPRPTQARLVRGGRTSRPTVRLEADDPRATRFLCRVAGAPAFHCDAGETRLPRLRGSGRTLTVRAGGPGMLFSTARRIRLGPGDRTRPRVRIRNPRGQSVRTIRGTASDRSGNLRRVDVAVVYFDNGCLRYNGRRFVRDACPRRTFVRATGARRWRLRLPRAIRGPIAVYARATDDAGNRSRLVLLRTVLPR